MSTAFFKSLADHFSLPDLQGKEGVKVHDWTWADGPWIEFHMFLDCTADEYLYKKAFYVAEFREHCELTNEIPVNAFCSWFESLSWEEKVVEIESFADARGLLEEIKQDYANWQLKQAI